MTELKPQPGPQEVFLSTPADIAFYGGAAGGGKSWAMLVDPLRHVNMSDFGAVIFRRIGNLIDGQGGLWDESEKIYPLLEGTPVKHKRAWVFPSGAKVKFSHMEHESNAYDWQGAQIPMIGWDELTHFTRKQFMYMLSRNRSTCGVAPYMRGTCNPDCGSWVREIIDWYIDRETGYAIPERSGVIRWFVVLNDSLVWGDSKEELMDKYHEEYKVTPLSFTFILATLKDNKILMEKDPSYLSKLQALPLIERERLLGGNWNINEDSGIIKREWINYYDTLPPVKFWAWTMDTAIKEKQVNDPSAIQLWAACDNGYYLEYSWKERVPYPVLKDTILNLYAKQPAREVLIEDKASGQQLVQDFTRTTTMPIIPMMPGKNMGKTKIERVNFVSTLYESGRVFVKRGQEWTNDFIDELVAFPSAAHDDQVDAMSQFLSRRLLLGDGYESDFVPPIFSTGGTIDQAPGVGTAQGEYYNPYL